MGFLLEIPSRRLTLCLFANSRIDHLHTQNSMNTNDKIKRLTCQFGDDDAVVELVGTFKYSLPTGTAPPSLA